MRLSFLVGIFFIQTPIVILVSLDPPVLGETGAGGEPSDRPPRGRTAPVHPAVLTTDAQPRDRCPSHARPNSRMIFDRTYKAGYRDPNHLWSGYRKLISGRAYRTRRHRLNVRQHPAGHRRAGRVL